MGDAPGSSEWRRAARRVTVPTIALLLGLAAGSCAGAGTRDRGRSGPPGELHGFWHQAAAGESLELLSRRFRVPLADLVELNALDPRDPWPVGRPLFIPGRRSRVGVGQAPPPRTRLPMRLVWPVPSGRLSSPFGPRAGRPHEGIDIRAPEGSPVIAAAAGTVVYAGSGVRGYGHLVLVRHARGVVTVYAHNRRNLVKEGDAVNQGQPIAEVGRSGRSDGFHLHFEVREGETPRDPLIDLRAPP